MDSLISFIEQYSVYFSIVTVALLSFFVSLPKDLNPLSAVELIFKQIAVKVNLDTRSDGYKRLASLLSISLIYFPTILIVSQLYNIVFQPITIDIVMLFVLLSWHDKKLVYLQVSNALKRNNLAQAKFKLDAITERETKPLSLMGVNKATIESMVLQLCASWFAVLFWYMVAGIYAAIFYRTVQICAQQWNAKNNAFKALTTFPSLFYSIMLFPVHLLVSFTFSLYDKPLQNLPKKFKQSIHWHHFSSGLMLSSFALSMQFELGGVRLYKDQKITYATLGNTSAPEIEQIDLSLQRLSLSAWFWLFCFSGYTFFPLLREFMQI
ncbi:cobalamin biosynthesis protein [Psychromonas sp. Urea-02u-13]|uniref:cobalamin biosynthesis protein n=1 Tax=Psychromonas sp. Urea-02u-13 TaxID=2058326 RepID=UPI000C329964|nr:cobalamin biosynthesis protein [Psychromonas sp. Urea-02u-13]PKG38392.1 adenosylcobinamide-phosphate synthase [Psychromonas sp. Urea-02u-13]